ncbi:hypothetical protein G3N59_22000 [Paraburkholderia sp. Ac-20340]|uniref:hypothetical protein n=1 Tax=Paraburkholderia sp. Ac-20340 TaxID=2703888 RepID=UPI00197CD8AB|nr:hypothetical protein [Paraburkholderia sp. Ac-20340]MBN3856052.1 hypothetical protein [Paraburkholderia sp. Ac-20340]
MEKRQDKEKKSAQVCTVWAKRAALSRRDGFFEVAIGLRRGCVNIASGLHFNGAIDGFF